MGDQETGHGPSIQESRQMGIDPQGRWLQHVLVHGVLLWGAQGLTVMLFVHGEGPWPRATLAPARASAVADGSGWHLGKGLAADWRVWAVPPWSSWSFGIFGGLSSHWVIETESGIAAFSPLGRVSLKLGKPT